MEGNVDLMIIDDFIKDKKLLKRLADTKGEFWEKGFSWWSGWWDSPVETLRHELIHKIWGENCPMQFNGITCAGFEHWIGRYGEGEDWQHLNIHKDKDEALYEKTGEFVYPKIGTIFYPVDHDIEGGELIVYDGDEYPTDDTQTLTVCLALCGLWIWLPTAHCRQRIYALRRCLSHLRRAL